MPQEKRNMSGAWVIKKRTSPPILGKKSRWSTAAQAGEGWESLVPGLVEKEVVICQEVGSGVIPLEKEARQMREYTGRLCTALAEQADRVVRLFCGIPTIIKE